MLLLRFETDLFLSLIFITLILFFSYNTILEFGIWNLEFGIWNLGLELLVSG